MAALSGLRVLLPLPPSDWFGGHDLHIALAAAAAFRKLDAIVKTVSVEAWNDPAQRFTVAWQLKEFSADLVFSLPNAGYGFQFFDRPYEDDKFDLFTDILSLPVVLPWDHLLTQAPSYVLGHKLESGKREYGVLDRIRSALSSKLRRHYVLDSGHQAIFEALGLLERAATERYISGAQDHFIEHGKRRAQPKQNRRVGFAGNIYPADSVSIPLLRDVTIASIDRAIIDGKRANWQASTWSLFTDSLSAASNQSREQAGLYPDCNVFWRVARDLLSKSVLTAFRLEVLGSITHPVDFYGNFAACGSHAATPPPNVEFHPSVDYETELASLYADYALWIDVTNTPFVNGCGSKVLNCFAAGSFMLVDYRQDLRDAVGETAESFMYRDRESLSEKIDYYFTRPSERMKVIEEMQSIIRERLSWQHFFQRACREVTNSCSTSN